NIGDGIIIIAMNLGQSGSFIQSRLQQTPTVSGQDRSPRVQVADIQLLYDLSWSLLQDTEHLL
ncbi:MAG: hypothetical protein ACFFAE_17815, partial [Candidatus Hodarchaeota archaeon]